MNDSPINDIFIGKVTAQWAQAQKIKTQYQPAVDSTNQLAKTQAFSETEFSEHLVLYVADHQTSGKGRGSNVWASCRPGSQLLSTWSFMISDPPQPTVSPLIGLALFKALSGTWPFIDFGLKAPNDILVNGKKLAGLLIESLSQGDDIRLIIGLGLNVLESPNLEIPTTNLLKELGGKNPLLAEDWIVFLERFLFELTVSLQQASEGLNSTTRASLAWALNKNTLQKEKVLSVDEDGSINSETKKIRWSEL